MQQRRSLLLQFYCQKKRRFGCPAQARRSCCLAAPCALSLVEGQSWTCAHIMVGVFTSAGRPSHSLALSNAVQPVSPCKSFARPPDRAINFSHISCRSPLPSPRTAQQATAPPSVTPSHSPRLSRSDLYTRPEILIIACNQEYFPVQRML